LPLALQIDLGDTRDATIYCVSPQARSPVAGVGELANKAEDLQMPFVRAVKIDEVPAGTVRELQVEGREIALANVGGHFYAINNTCLHEGGPLGEGSLEGKIITCPWHLWEYDVTTGKLLENPNVGVACYPTEVRGQEVFVDVGS
jgi:nitrite reductase (NADH) small subunit